MDSRDQRIQFPDSPDFPDWRDQAWDSRTGAIAAFQAQLDRMFGVGKYVITYEMEPIPVLDAYDA